MFAYCNNDPINYIDTLGTDAVWIHEEDSANGFGHAGLLVEDSNGDWWFFYWGPAKNNWKTYTIGVKPKCVLIKVDVSGRDLSNVDDVAAVLASVDDNNKSNDAKFVASRSKLVSDVIYFEGDYTNTYKYLDKLDKSKNKPKYQLFTNNCVQKTWYALASSNIAFSSHVPLIPNTAYYSALYIKYTESLEYLPRYYN